MTSNFVKACLYTIAISAWVTAALGVYGPMSLTAGSAYFGLLLIVAWSAFKYHQPGWMAGAGFAALTLTVPAWVICAFKLCEGLGLFGP
ncbi:MAG: hypothetical protein U0805_20115 [Pirellulales bacterium]